MFKFYFAIIFLSCFNKSTIKYGDIRYTNMFENSKQIIPNINEIKYDPPSPRYEKEKKLKIKNTIKK